MASTSETRTNAMDEAARFRLGTDAASLPMAMSSS
jgi:hypothetical protein